MLVLIVDKVSYNFAIGDTPLFQLNRGNGISVPYLLCAIGSVKNEIGYSSKKCKS